MRTSLSKAIIGKKRHVLIIIIIIIIIILILMIIIIIRISIANISVGSWCFTTEYFKPKNLYIKRKKKITSIIKHKYIKIQVKNSYLKIKIKD